MAKVNYLDKYASEKGKETLQEIKAAQEGGQAPAPEQAPQGPQGGGGQPDPQQMIMAYAQATQAGDEAARGQIAIAFMDMVVMPSMQQEQQAVQNVPAARGGGNAPSPVEFNADGTL